MVYLSPIIKDLKYTIMDSIIPIIYIHSNNYLIISSPEKHLKQLLESKQLNIQQQFEKPNSKELQQQEKSNKIDIDAIQSNLIKALLSVIIFIMKIEKAEDVQMILKTNKDSESGIFSNQRLLMIKAGIISYFSEASKKFTGSVKFLQSSGQFPKYTIKANDIDHIDLKNGVLSMLFKKSKLISRNQFQDMVKKKQIEPDRVSEISAKQQGSGFIKWNFQCENPQLLKQFFRLTNLFRSSNPRFQPNLGSVISSFRGQKRQGEGRQLSMKASSSNKMYNSELDKKRMSQIPIIQEGKDLFLQSIGIIDKQQQPSEQIIKQLPKSQPIKQEIIDIKDNKQLEKLQSQRLNKLKNKIQSMNQPIMQTILERQNQDKMSEISRNPRDTITQRKISIKHTSSELIEPIIPISPEPQPPKQIEPQPQPEPSPIQQPQAEKVQEKKSQPIKIEQQQVISQNQVSSIKAQDQIINETNTPPNFESSVLQVTQKSLQIPKIQQKIKLNKQIQFTLNTSYDESSIIQQQSKRKKRKKVHQFFKAATYIDNFNPKQVCRKLSISLQGLQQLINNNKKQQQSSWPFIQNNLAYKLSKQNKSIIHISNNLINNYNKIQYTQKQQYFQFLKIQLDNQISYITSQPKNQQQNQAIKWMQSQMENIQPKQFSSKILNKLHFKIYIKSFNFQKQNIIHLKSGWIINKNGHLEQFLAYLRLEKILKQINHLISDDMELICGESIYLRYKQYQGIAKQWRIGHPCLPIKSIKALQYITKSKQFKIFNKDYPQFNIIAQIIKQGYKYRLHLDRIQGQQKYQNQQSLLNQLKKLIFPFDNQLDIFYNHIQYNNIQNYCLQKLSQIMNKKSRIQHQDLYSIMQNMQNNISVDTLCKLLGCRIDKKGNLYFHHIILKTGGRQFGQQISLIKRSKKKGNIQLGRQLSKRLMGKLKQYQKVTPISHCIQIYLQIIDFMIVGQGQLHRAVKILLKVLDHLGDSEAQQYPIYLALMKAYLKLDDLNNFIKILQNCRLFISQMFKKYSPLIDYSLQRIIIMILLKQNPQKALNYTNQLLKQLQENIYFTYNIKQKYICKIQWDKNNILILLSKTYQAYHNCLNILNHIQSNTHYYPDYWIQGVLCLSKSWLQIDQINSINATDVQRRIAHAIQLSFSRENMEMVFVLFQTGETILNRCDQFDLPKLLNLHSAFEQARIEFNETQSQILYILSQNQQ